MINSFYIEKKYFSDEEISNAISIIKTKKNNIGLGLKSDLSIVGHDYRDFIA